MWTGRLPSLTSFTGPTDMVVRAICSSTACTSFPSPASLTLPLRRTASDRPPDAGFYLSNIMIRRTSVMYLCHLFFFTCYMCKNPGFSFSWSMFKGITRHIYLNMCLELLLIFTKFRIGHISELKR